MFAAAAIARQAKVTVVLDPNMRFKLWTPDQAREVLLALTREVDILLPGADEAELLTGEGEPLAAARRLVALGPRLVIVKLGPEGALAVTADEATPVPALQLPKVVDPVGAGDGFAAGFLAGQLKGLDLVESLALANRAGALATTVPSDLEGLPRWDEVSAPGSERDVLR